MSYMLYQRKTVTLDDVRDELPRLKNMVQKVVAYGHMGEDVLQDIARIEEDVLFRQLECDTFGIDADVQLTAERKELSRALSGLQGELKKLRQHCGYEPAPKEPEPAPSKTTQPSKSEPEQLTAIEKLLLQEEEEQQRGEALKKQKKKDKKLAAEKRRKERKRNEAASSSPPSEHSPEPTLLETNSNCDVDIDEDEPESTTENAAPMLPSKQTSSVEHTLPTNVVNPNATIVPMADAVKAASIPVPAAAEPKVTPSSSNATARTRRRKDDDFIIDQSSTGSHTLKPAVVPQPLTTSNKNHSSKNESFAPPPSSYMSAGPLPSSWSSSSAAATAAIVAPVNPTVTTTNVTAIPTLLEQSNLTVPSTSVAPEPAHEDDSDDFPIPTIVSNPLPKKGPSAAALAAAAAVASIPFELPEPVPENRPASTVQVKTNKRSTPASTPAKTSTAIKGTPQPSPSKPKPAAEDAASGATPSTSTAVKHGPGSFSVLSGLEQSPPLMPAHAPPSKAVAPSSSTKKAKGKNQGEGKRAQPSADKSKEITTEISLFAAAGFAVIVFVISALVAAVVVPDWVLQS